MRDDWLARRYVSRSDRRVRGRALGHEPRGSCVETSLLRLPESLDVHSWFFVGQIVHHKKFDYRGVVFDVDATFQGTGTVYLTHTHTSLT